MSLSKPQRCLLSHLYLSLKPFEEMEHLKALSGGTLLFVPAPTRHPLFHPSWPRLPAWWPLSFCRGAGALWSQPEPDHQARRQPSEPPLGAAYSEITVKTGKCSFSHFSRAERVRRAFSQSCCLLIRYVCKRLAWPIWLGLSQSKLRYAGKEGKGKKASKRQT